MSAIVAAMVAAREEYDRTRNPEDAVLLAWDLDDACKAIVRASNAAGAGRVVEGAPRTWVRWWCDGDSLVAAPRTWVRWWCDGDSLVAAAWGKTYRVGMPPRAGLRPTWDTANRLWVWSTATHDPRPCAWPRPFARGADR
jgi:hypothetical protein